MNDSKLNSYYEESNDALGVLRDKYSDEEINIIGFTNTILWKKYQELNGIVELNELNQSKVNLINNRIGKYLDFIENTINDNETRDVLIEEFKLLFDLGDIK